jgi:hypothetical protein
MTRMFGWDALAFAILFFLSVGQSRNSVHSTGSPQQSGAYRNRIAVFILRAVQLTTLSKVAGREPEFGPTVSVSLGLDSR